MGEFFAGVLLLFGAASFGALETLRFACETLQFRRADHPGFVENGFAESACFGPGGGFVVGAVD